MEKFQRSKELNEHLVKVEYPEEVKERLLFQIGIVETCNNEGAGPTYLVIATTKNAEEELEKEFALSELEPEFYQYHKTVDGEYWRERVYVLGDAGNGIVCFEKCR